jgi:hypothetical protein
VQKIMLVRPATHRLCPKISPFFSRECRSLLESNTVPSCKPLLGQTRGQEWLAPSRTEVNKFREEVVVLADLYK